MSGAATHPNFQSRAHTRDICVLLNHGYCLPLRAIFHCRHQLTSSFCTNNALCWPAWRSAGVASLSLSRMSWTPLRWSLQFVFFFICWALQYLPTFRVGRTSEIFKLGESCLPAHPCGHESTFQFLCESATKHDYASAASKRVCHASFDGQSSPLNLIAWLNVSSVKVLKRDVGSPCHG